MINVIIFILLSVLFFIWSLGLAWIFIPRISIPFLGSGSCQPKISWKNHLQGQNGVNIHAKCKYCGKDIIRDSQGNWF